MKDILLLAATLFCLLAEAQVDIFDAARRGDTTAAKAMLQINADTVNARNASGYSPLVLAAYYDQVGFMAFLLKNGAVIKDKPGDETALQASAFKGFPASVELLLKAGAPVDVADGNGATPLIYAAQMNHVLVAQLLVKAGANPYLTDESNKSALDYARLLGFSEMTEVLERR